MSHKIVFASFSRQCLFSTLQSSTIFTSQFSPEIEQKRTIVDKRLFKLPENYPEPWPYKEKPFPHRLVAFDPGYARRHQNSKLIIVEGNIGSGKSEFARQLADELGFYHMPSFSMNDILIDRYGNDMRKFHHLFPKRFRVPDEIMFYKDPASDQTAVMQNTIYQSRFDQYLNALAHILNTGQGVVLERSIYSDFVFVNAMREKDWISPEFFKYYHFMRKISLQHIAFYPHLMIYLDVPISKSLEKIKQRGDPYEIAAVDERYLMTIKESYKDLIRELKRHSYILTYDWTEPEYMDVVLDDIFKLNMDSFRWHYGDVLASWDVLAQSDLEHNRHRYFTTYKIPLFIRAFGNLDELDCEVSELYIYPPDGMHFRRVMMHEVLKDFHTYGYVKGKDPIAGYNYSDIPLVVPEGWYDYWWREHWYNSMHFADTFLDPYGYYYDPEYLHH
ncbi:hypothetical protein ACQ4LE_003134 [Meloidogyne hapla]|uniref:NADH dehydrogenase [ubiquinone] 1 alpha subcomplex subunit 10, mitochondrial n=1 Tax=Meloidogyne hapla TaxID=6305 RepID=A0A1I8B772_MELHA